MKDFFLIPGPTDGTKKWAQLMPYFVNGVQIMKEVHISCTGELTIKMKGHTICNEDFGLGPTISSHMERDFRFIHQIQPCQGYEPRDRNVCGELWTSGADQVGKIRKHGQKCKGYVQIVRRNKVSCKQCLGAGYYENRVKNEGEDSDTATDTGNEDGQKKISDVLEKLGLSQNCRALVQNMASNAAKKESKQYRWDPW